MKLPRDLGGRQLANTLVRRWGYVQVHQVGSHIILQTGAPEHHRIAIPDHKPLRIGTLNAILRTISTVKGVTRQAIVDSL